MAECGDYTVRQARKEDMSAVMPLIWAEEWQCTLDAVLFQFELFPSGSFVAESSEGEIIGHCSAVPLDDSTGMVAFYVTKKSWRGKGIGRKIFDLSCKALGSRQIGLNSEGDRQDMYSSGGFKISTFCLTSYVCSIRSLTLKELIPLKETMKISPIREVEFEQILAYDKKINPIDRTEVLKWFIEFSHVGFAIFEGNELRGWAMLYKSPKGFRMMPLYADSGELARVLANELLKSVTKADEALIEVAFPDDNVEAKKLYEELGMTNGQTHYSRRMFNEYDVPVANNLIYSILNYDNVLA